MSADLDRQILDIVERMEAQQERMARRQVGNRRRLQLLEEQIRRLWQVVADGNGQPSLMSRVATLEGRNQSEPQRSGWRVALVELKKVSWPIRVILAVSIGIGAAGAAVVCLLKIGGAL
jgi:hypothetical protein